MPDQTLTPALCDSNSNNNNNNNNNNSNNNNDDDDEENRNRNENSTEPEIPEETPSITRFPAQEAAKDRGL
uniref:Uncharacterized protein n=1 Tax=Vespula pensylvanica TaxID=30213 RepID=A0A834UD51_VESPE|nr:hypothetical protein H0235_004715 [Vespula pensylvanica]